MKSEFSSMRPPTQVKGRLSLMHRSSLHQVWRFFVLGITFVIVSLFIYHLASKGGFFCLRQIFVSGSEHYTANEIIAALGLDLKQNNVHTLSEEALEKHLKSQLSYVKSADISKSVVERALRIEMTERKPAAQLKYQENIVLVDLEGYVLEYIDFPQASDATVIIGDVRELPPLGSQIQSKGVQLALSILRSAFSLTPEVVSTLQTIDANQPDRMILQFSNLPVVWLSSDLIGTGLHHTAIFMKNQAAIMKAEEEKKASLKMKGRRKNRGASVVKAKKGKKAAVKVEAEQVSHRLEGYLDMRFEEAIYWGGKGDG